MTIAAAPQRGDAEFNKVTAQELFIENDAGLLQVGLSANETGGMLGIYNKTGEGVVQLRADQHGNGVVGVYNRKGLGRTLEPGPQ